MHDLKYCEFSSICDICIVNGGGGAAPHIFWKGPSIAGAPLVKVENQK